MVRVILLSNLSKLEDVYRNSKEIEVIKLEDSMVQDLYQSSDYKITIKDSLDECELLAGKNLEKGEIYKWGIKVNKGEIETFKTLLKTVHTSITEE